ncbi:lysophospholipase L1-like esterase [Curtobacterium sp. PhB172]|nr:lysophospholipase L1-like esterase [Curtobacterium sp. PhB171]ROQ22265.1 lysophospholipase L1-like esterase [Curtobacterium sp. PhB170]ROS33625.1 lysophospholipase L1-like esterase [Curtobacterium sp. PhB131]ROS64944.1 lysophospholipase L1-like esterase [Curtobacterium sp. PhB141]ROS69064.1 lysophospholipase L1-like esterase [Curtobacterium sp. PhB172]
MALGVGGFLVMLPAVSDACLTIPATSTVSASRVSSAMARGAEVLIVGDSYTVGRGSSDGVHGWAQDLATERGWDATIDGVAGSGYVNTGRSHSPTMTYRARIEQNASLDPRLVIVQGSQNDWLVSASTLEERVEQALRTAKRQWPDAVVVAIGPSAPQPRAETTVAISAAVAAGARDAGVPFVDAVDRQWFTAMNSGSYAAGDGQHLNDDGYRYLADKIDGALEQLASADPSDRCS